MTTKTLLLVARSETRAQSYREALELRGFACNVISELREAPAQAAQTAFNGVLLDMPVITKASQHEKTLLEDLLQALPSAYLNIAPATDSIKLLPVNANHGTARTLEEFLAICQNVAPRPVRPNDRAPLHLNALLTHLDQCHDAEQTVTLNISEQGCFLFSTNPHNAPEQQVAIEFVGLQDRTPIRATIRWVRHWGEVHHMPGIGVSFDLISEAQIRQLASLIAAKRSP